MGGGEGLGKEILGNLAKTHCSIPHEHIRTVDSIFPQCSMQPKNDD